MTTCPRRVITTVPGANGSASTAPASRAKKAKPRASARRAAGVSTPSVCPPRPARAQTRRERSVSGCSPGPLSGWVQPSAEQPVVAGRGSARTAHGGRHALAPLRQDGRFFG